jgi:hypothetical protein
MTATFDPALLTARDRLRLRLSDTDVGAAKSTGADPLALPVDDAVYAGALALHGNDERMAGLELVRALIGKYAQMETKASVDGVESAEWANRLVAWRALETRWATEIAAEAPTVAGRGSFSVARAHRPGCEPRAEYYAGGRPPLDRDY